MSNVEAIEQQVKNLSPAELIEFRDWFAEFTADAWDARIERDATAGRLDELAAEARAEFDAGQASEL